MATRKTPARKSAAAPRRKSAAKKTAAKTPAKAKKAGQTLKSGDHVTWGASQGKTSGKIVAKETGTARVKGHVAKASKSAPQYRVKSDKSGKEAIHRPEALRKD